MRVGLPQTPAEGPAGRVLPTVAKNLLPQTQQEGTALSSRCWASEMQEPRDGSHPLPWGRRYIPTGRQRRDHGSPASQNSHCHPGEVGRVNPSSRKASRREHLLQWDSFQESKGRAPGHPAQRGGGRPGMSPRAHTDKHTSITLILQHALEHVVK